MTLLIAGTAGADPSGLAAAVKRGGWTGRVVVAGTAAEVASQAAAARVAVLALDSAMPAAEEEADFLAVLAAARTSTALVACGVDAFPSWPRTLAASRSRLDPERRLPVFATAAALADVRGAQSGVPELAQWCAEDHDQTTVPRSRKVGVLTVDDKRSSPTVDGAPSRSPGGAARGRRRSSCRGRVVDPVRTG